LLIFNFIWQSLSIFGSTLQLHVLLFSISFFRKSKSWILSIPFCVVRNFTNLSMAWLWFMTAIGIVGRRGMKVWSRRRTIRGLRRWGEEWEMKSNGGERHPFLTIVWERTTMGEERDLRFPRFQFIIKLYFF